MGAEVFLRRGVVFFCSGICVSEFCVLMVLRIHRQPGKRKENSWAGDRMANAKLRFFPGKVEEEERNVAEKTAE